MRTRPPLGGYDDRRFGCRASSDPRSRESRPNYLQQAGDTAAARSAHVEAVGHLTTALQLLERLPGAPNHRCATNFGPRVSHFVAGSLRSENWYTEADYDWLPAGGVIADCLKDLSPDGGTLSVYEVEETASDDFVRRIAAAIAAGADNPRDVAYFRFERAVVEALQITINSDEPGHTGDAEVNTPHRDLQHLSASKLAELAGVMAHGTPGQFTAKTLRERIKVKVEAQRLSRDRVSRKLRNELGLG